MEPTGRPPMGRPFLLTEREPARPPIALTIGGSDSSGGAGIQADLSTFAVHGVFGAAAIARVTVQNTLGVRAVQALEPEFVAAQLEAALDDLPVDAAKTGSLGSAETIAAVAAVLRARRVGPLVVDPVSVAKSGAPLLDPAGQRALLDELAPLATVLTPNVREAEALLGGRIRGYAEAVTAIQQLRALIRVGATDGAGPLVVITHVPHAERAVDLICDAAGVGELSAELIPDAPTHGAGCVFAADITAELARGREPRAAVVAAKRFVTEAIRRGPRLAPGRGPVNPSAVRPAVESATAPNERPPAIHQR